MTHPNEEELVEAYYQGLDSPLESHLEICPECNSQYQNLAEILDAAREAAIPERDAAYGREVWARLLPQLQPDRARFKWPRWWLLAPTASMFLTIVFVLGMFTEHRRSAALVPETKNDRVLYLAMSDHLQQSQILLTELAHVGSGIDQERERARDLITRNRLLRLRALRAKDAADAAVLDDLERVLLQVANGDSSLESVRHRVEDGNLLFRVRISGSDARARGEKL